MHITGILLQTYAQKALASKGEFADQSFSGKFVFISLNFLFKSNLDNIKFIILHEYGHIHENSTRITLAYIILGQTLFTLLYALIIFVQSKYRPIVKTKARLMILLSCYLFLLKSLNDVFYCLRAQYFEFKADDFALSFCEDNAGITEFFISESYGSKYPGQRYFMFYPPYIIYLTHPSIYHRYIRQILKNKSN